MLYHEQLSILRTQKVRSEQKIKKIDRKYIAYHYNSQIIRQYKMKKLFTSGKSRSILIFDRCFTWEGRKKRGKKRWKKGIKKQVAYIGRNLNMITVVLVLLSVLRVLRPIRRYPML